MSIKVITGPITHDELVAIFCGHEFEGLLVAGIREPDPLIWVCDLRNSYPRRALPVAILHSPEELNALSLAQAAKRFREMESHQHPGDREKRTILVDRPGRQVVVDGLQQNLSPAEFRLLLFLVRYCGIAFSRGELLHRTRSSKTEVDPRIIDVLIWRLRSKIDGRETGPSHFITLHRIGYQFLRHDDAFIDRFTRRPFESLPCCPDAEGTPLP